jgi:hypothetical protein
VRSPSSGSAPEFVWPGPPGHTWIRH